MVFLACAISVLERSKSNSTATWSESSITTSKRPSTDPPAGYRHEVAERLRRGDGDHGHVGIDPTGGHRDKRDPLQRKTTLGYTELLTQLRILDPLAAWTPSRNHCVRIGAAEKHFLADPALAARLLDRTREDLLAGDDGPVRVPRDGSLLGNLFESLVAFSIRSFAQNSVARGSSASLRRTPRDRLHRRAPRQGSRDRSEVDRSRRRRDGYAWFRWPCSDRERARPTLPSVNLASRGLATEETRDGPSTANGCNCGASGQSEPCDATADAIRVLGTPQRTNTAR